jgi:hypothetical protein
MAIEHKSVKFAKGYLLGMTRRAELLPGASERILKRFENQGQQGVRLVRQIDEYLAGHGAKYLDPRGQKREELPVETAINRLVAGGIIRKEAAPALIKDWAVDFAGGDPVLAADQVAAKLDNRENANFALVDPPPPPVSEQNVRTVLEQLKYHLAPGVSLDGVAHDFRDLGASRTGQQLASAIVSRLNSRPHLLANGSLAPDILGHLFRDERPSESDGPPSQAYDGF